MSYIRRDINKRGVIIVVPKYTFDELNTKINVILKLKIEELYLVYHFMETRLYFFLDLLLCQFLIRS